MTALRGLAKPVRYAALVTGILPVLALPAANLEFLAWFGLVPGLALMRAAPDAREAAVRGWWFGTGFLLTAMYWLAPELGPALLLVAVVLGVLWAGVGVATWALLRPPVSARRGLAALVVVPSCWLVIDWIRSWQALGGPWAIIGVSQWQHPATLALAAVGGVWLVSFAIVAANVGILIALLAGRVAVRLTGALATAVVIAAGPVAFALTPAAPVAGHVTVALVQPGIQPSDAARTAASLRLTASVIRPGHSDLGLVVWGESSVGSPLHSSRQTLARIEALSAAARAEILVNQDSLSDGKKSKVAVLVGPHGITGEYVKTRLVPFGEYIPFRQALGWLTSISRAAYINMTPGLGARVLHAAVPGGQARAPGQKRAPGQVRPPGRALAIGPLICFESAFPDMSRVDTDRGARVIVYQTADSTFQGTWALDQHASLGALRAAETGRPVVQAALTGDSAAFDARGRLLGWLGQTRRGVLLARLALPPPAARTPYDRLGDFVPWIAVAITLISGAAGSVRAGLPARLRRIWWGGKRRRASAAAKADDPLKSGVMAGRDDSAS